MATKGPVKAIAGLIAVLMLTAAGWGSWERFHGQVIDAETGKPIPGAVIVFQWMKRHRLGMDGPEYVQNVQEVVTDSEGRFSVDPSPGVNWNPLTFLSRLYVTTFAPGYEPAPTFVVIKEAESSTEKLAALEAGIVTRLQPFGPSSRTREMVSLGALGIAEDARHRVPNLTRAVDEQRRRLGLEN